MRALEHVQRTVICAKVAVPVQSNHPSLLNVTQEHAANLEALLGAMVRLCHAARQGNLTASRCWVWHGARFPCVLCLWWGFLQCLHMGILSGQTL